MPDTDPRVLVVAQPAAGADWSEVISTSKVFKVLSVRAQFQASGVAGNRVNSLRAKTADNDILWDTPGVANPTANQLKYLNWFVGCSQALGFSPYEQLFLPDLWLPAGTTIQTVSTNMDVGDQFSLIVISYLLAD